MTSGAREYIVVAGVEATFEALRRAVGERKLSPVEDDQRHHRLAFRLDQPHEGNPVKALCAVLDIGHGLSKLVVVCVDEADGSIVAADATLESLFMQVEHALHTAPGSRMDVALPPLLEVELMPHPATGEQAAAGKPTTHQRLP
jgi:hypothetical protein